MKTLLILILLSVINLSYGWECNGSQRGSDTSYDQHIEYASEIYAGKVITSYLVEDIHKIVFELKISDAFKGHYKNHITLETTDDGLDPDITIGESYIFFLYGSNSVSFCGLNIPLGKGIFRPENLEHMAKNVESENKNKAKFLRKLLKMKNNNL
jgi:hypothetical protein